MTGQIIEATTKSIRELKGAPASFKLRCDDGVARAERHTESHASKWR